MTLTESVGQMNDKKKPGCLAIGAIALSIFGAALIWVQTGQHLSPPPGHYDRAVEGVYAVECETNYQIPEVFADAFVTVTRSQRGGMQIECSAGSVLQLQDAADGWYFSQSFNPSGPIILPGIARNWNEGCVTVMDDGLVVEGYMLEKGLMLFLIPFADAPSKWSIKLTHADAADIRAESQ